MFDCDIDWSRWAVCKEGEHSLYRGTRSRAQSKGEEGSGKGLLGGSKRKCKA